ncbi:hypothetical protein [Actinokineospora sp. NPDC004072]
MRDMVHIYISADVPIRSEPLPFADRLEIRLGKAYPVVVVVDRPALDLLARAIESGRTKLDAAAKKQEG